MSDVETEPRSLREHLFPVTWKALWPVRAYVRYSPSAHGKGFLRRAVIKPMLPPDARQFVVTGPQGARLSLRYGETLGISYLLHGGFEMAEIQTLCRLVKGATAIDVGANIGAFAIPLALAAGPTGSVVAIEPLPENIERLRANVVLNQISNVRIEAQAAGDRDGVTELRLSADSAYGSTSASHVYQESGCVLEVPVVRLDQLWASLGRPEVSVLKIDVEGGEAHVLRGASELLRLEQPAVLVEANSGDQAAAVSRILSALGYEASRPSGFMPWNYLFTKPH